MRIGILTQWFEPEPGPASLPGMLARGLVERGHEVHVLTGFPNYPTGQIADGYRQRRRMDEMHEGVHVRRVALYPSHDGSAARRVANYGSFAASAVASGMDALRTIDALWVNYSPVTIGLPMFVQGWMCRTPTVVHVLDLWPDTAFASRFAGQGRASRLVWSAVNQWCRAMYDRAHTVGYISPGVGAVLEQRHVPQRKLRYVPMWADESMSVAQPSTSDRRGWGLGADTIVLAYAGTLGKAQDLTTLIRACAQVRDLNFRCLIAGSGLEEDTLRRLSVDVGATNVEFLGRVDRREVADLMTASDLQYVALNDHPLARITMPSKVQSILASSRPIVGSLLGDAADVVERSGGWSTPPGDVAGVVDALRAAAAIGRSNLARAGRRAREYYEEEFSMELGIGRIEKMLIDAATA